MRLKYKQKRDVAASQIKLPKEMELVLYFLWKVLSISNKLGTGHKVQGGVGWKKGGVGHCFHACKKGWASKNHASLKGWGT